jgi:glycosyltransferase involved in cell wall biosynthesis
VIIPAKDAADSLPRALDSIRSQTYPNITEVIVAAADPQTAAAAGDAFVAHNPAGTTPVGLNLAIAAASGDVIVRCDVHSVLPVGYVTQAVETLERTGADNVGGMQVPVGATPWEKAVAAAMTSPLGAGDARYRLGGDEGPVETVYLGVYRRTILGVLGGFDESFPRTQDYELNHRIIESGGVVWFDPELRVEYRPRGSLRSLGSQYFQYGRAKRRFNRKHPGGLRWRQTASPLILITIAVCLVTAVRYPVTLVIPSAYLAAVAIEGIRAGQGKASWLGIAVALLTMHMTWGAGFLRG